MEIPSGKSSSRLESTSYNLPFKYQTGMAGSLVVKSVGPVTKRLLV